MLRLSTNAAAETPVFKPSARSFTTLATTPRAALSAASFSAQGQGDRFEATQFGLSRRGFLGGVVGIIFVPPIAGTLASMKIANDKRKIEQENREYILKTLQEVQNLATEPAKNLTNLIGQCKEKPASIGYEFKRDANGSVGAPIAFFLPEETYTINFIDQNNMQSQLTAGSEAISRAFEYSKAFKTHQLKLSSAAYAESNDSIYIFNVIVPRTSA